MDRRSFIRGGIVALGVPLAGCGGGGSASLDGVSASSTGAERTEVTDSSVSFAIDLLIQNEGDTAVTEPTADLTMTYDEFDVWEGERTFQTIPAGGEITPTVELTIRFEDIGGPEANALADQSVFPLLHITLSSGDASKDFTVNFTIPAR